MRQGLLGIALAAGLSALAGCTDSGVIQGHVVVGPGQGGLEVFAVLLELQPQQVDDGTTKLRWTAIAQQAVGAATSDGGSFAYTFYGLEKGTYALGAYADLHNDRDITDDASTFDVNSPLDLDPAAKDKQSFTRDVFVAASAPDKGTVRGTLHASSRADALGIQLFVLDKPISDATATVVSSTRVAAGSDVPFALFNVPPGAGWLVAEADVGDDGDSSNDLFGFYALNPFHALAGKDSTGIDVWFDRQSPDLAQIAGKISLNAPLPALSIQLLVLEASADPNSNAPVLDQGASILAILNLDAHGTVSVPFQLPSLKKGKHFLAALLESKEADGVHRTSRIYSVNDKEMAIDTNDPGSQQVNFPLGVGRCSGTIKLHNAPASLKTVAVFAVVPGAASQPGSPGSPVIREAQAAAVNVVNGEGSAPYQMFGLEDGTYDMSMIPDLNGDGSVQEEYEANQTYNGTPLRVTITGGGRVGSDFDVTFK